MKQEKYKKLMLWIGVFCLIGLAQTAQGKDISEVFCEDVIQIGSNCTMATPVSNCDVYNYDIINLSDGVYIVEDAPLTLLQQDIYKFNFTNISHAGNYVIRLCNGATREIIIEGGVDVDYGIAIIIAIMSAAGILAFLMYIFRPTEDTNLGIHMSVMRMFLFFGCLYTVIAGLGFAVNIADNQGLSSGFISPLIAAFSNFIYFIWIAAIVTIIFFIFDLFWTFKQLGGKEE